MKYKVLAYDGGKVVDCVLCETHEKALVEAAKLERTKLCVTEIVGHYDTRL